MTTVVGVTGFEVSNLIDDLTNLQTGTGQSQTTTTFGVYNAATLSDEEGLLLFNGTGFGGYVGNHPTTGTITGLQDRYGTGTPVSANWTGMNLSVADFNAYVAANNIAAMQNAIFGGADNITGANMNDQLFGYAGNDQISGLGGNDILVPGAGADTVLGGDGDDGLIILGGAETGDTWNGGANTDVISIISGNWNLRAATITNFERVNFSFVTANSRADFDMGDIPLNGLILGSGFADSINFVASTAGTYSFATMLFANWTNNVDQFSATGSDGDDIITGTNFNDLLDGDNGESEVRGDDQLFGGGGNDWLDGWSGRDELHGGAGDDVIVGWQGETDAGEILDGGDNTDTLMVVGDVDFTSAFLTSLEKVTFVQDAVDASDFTVNGAHVLAAQLGGGQLAANIVVTGSVGSHVDTLDVLATGAATTINASAWTFANWSASDIISLRGSDVADNITGSSGRDIINGGLGADTVTGGLGDDTMYVDNAGDVAAEGVNEGIDTVVASRSWAVGSNIEKVILTGTGDFNAAGNGLANNLKGNSGDNWLNGSFGKDTLTGGGGRDSFIFNRTLGANNIDTITDYDVVRDVIRIDNAVFAGIGPAGALAAGLFNTGAAATEADDRIIYDQTTGKLFFDIDGVGGAAQQHFATLSTKPAGMTAGEFIII